MFFPYCQYIYFFSALIIDLARSLANIHFGNMCIGSGIAPFYSIWLGLNKKENTFEGAILPKRIMNILQN